MWRSRSWLPIGLVGRDRRYLDDPAAFEHASYPTLWQAEALGGVLPSDVLLRFRDRCVEGAVLDAWEARYGRVEQEMIQILSVLAGVGVMGGLRCRAAVHLKISVRNLDRRLRRAGLPTAHHMLRDARLRAVDIGRGLGMNRIQAVSAAGWDQVKSWEKMCVRERHDHQF